MGKGRGGKGEGGGVGGVFRLPANRQFHVSICLDLNVNLLKQVHQSNLITRPFPEQTLW